jgi:DNA-binding SARP family transcriptional activator
VAQLQIFLLGPPEIRWESNLLAIQRRYPRALLFYLAARGGMVGRQELLTLFWEDEAETTARQRLRETLSRLKTCLPDPGVLIVSQDLIGLDFEKVYVDQIEYRNLLHRAGATVGSLSQSQPLTAEIYQLLQAAVRLWRSPHYLAGSRLPSTVNLDHWLTQTAQKLEYQRSRILDRLADHALSIGELEAALIFSQFAVESDEMNEASHERVIRILMLLGKKNEAAQAYQQFRELFQNELSRASISRLEKLLQPTPPPPVSLPVPTAYDWNLHPVLDVPFVGRAEPLQALWQAWKAGGGIAIIGESGIGKTRLVKEFVSQIDPQTRIMQTRCLPNESHLPLQALIDLGRREVMAEEWRKFPAEWGSHMVPLLPELASVRADFQRLYTPPERAQSLLLESIRQMALMISEQQRFLVFIDDLQWADQGTLDTIAYLLERPPFHPGGSSLLILAVRAEELSSSLEKFISRLQQSNRLSKIELGTLKDQEIQELAQVVLGMEPAKPLIKNLTDSSGGNPLFLLETLRQMKDQAHGKSRFATISHPSHQNTRALIKARLDSISNTSRTCLETAAIIGSEFDPDLVKEVTQLSEQGLIDAFEELEKKVLVEPAVKNALPLKYRFIHDKFREVLLDELNQRRVQFLHRAIALAIQNRPGGTRPGMAAILAEHYEAAGSLVNAFEQWVRAGEYAYRMLAFESARQIFTQAESLLPILEPEISNLHLEQLFHAWNEMAFELDDSAGLESMNQRLLKLARQRQNPALVGFALIGLSRACLVSSRFLEGLEFSAQAIETLQPLKQPYLLALANLIRGTLFYMQNCWEEAEEIFQRVLNICQSGEDENLQQLEAKARCQYAAVLNMTGWPTKGYDQVTQALSGGLLVFQPYEQISAHSIRAYACHLMGDYRTARAEIQRGLARAEEIHSFRVSGYLFGLQALTEMSMGNFSLAWETVDRTIELGKELSHPDVIATGYRLKGDLFAVLKAYELALEQYQIGIGATQEGFWGLENLLRVGYMECLIGQTSTGMDKMTRAVSLAKDHQLLIPYIIGQISLATVYYLLKEYPQAESIAADIHELASARSLQVWQAACRSISGAVQYQTGQIGEAMSTFQQVLKQARRFPNVWMELRAEAFLAKCDLAVDETNLSHQQRVTDILERIRLSIHPELQQIFEAFCQQDQATF